MADADLPAFKQRVVDLHVVQGLSLRLVSERLGIPVSTITHRLARLKKLEEKVVLKCGNIRQEDGLCPQHGEDRCCDLGA